MKHKILTMTALFFLLNCSPKDVSDNMDTSEDLARDFVIKSDLGLEDSAADLLSLGLPEITRTTPEKCDNIRPNQTINSTRSIGCETDDECADGVNGRCIAEWNFEELIRSCTYDDCFKDDDCGQGTACSCGKDENSDAIAGLGADENRCVPASCKTDNDCGDQFCKPDPSECPEAGSRVYGYFCTSERDQCRNDSDCGGSVCQFWAQESKWICMYGCP